MPTPARSRRTQEERTATTRLALLDATIECLIEHGYHGTTTTRVVERAGVSRGAQVHHFPTKNDLVVAAVQHLAVRRADEFMERSLGTLQRSDDWFGDTLDLVWEIHQGSLFEASMELWVASRTDPELREHVAEFERVVTGSIIELATALFGDRVDDPRFRGDVYLVLETIRGLRMLQFVHPATAERTQERWERSKARLRLLAER
ncbi:MULTISPECIES: TetR/AcrR family transcriptional regulator [Thermomonosporaceae]|uniref:TetR/AcrR family transcriptional regulator n=1 Tax=Thermomonosporaceae TaxID=2012 RepID=UPI00255A9AE3|nr:MULTISPECIES: TetR/AcrR family transcriptional regulator [Thermomonosporaceae]MDL4773276.1 helix-turn-helix domain-containing protein [Actinomadura xylanilytica]